MPRYIHPHFLVLWEWLYQATIYPPPPTHGIDYKDIIFSLPRKLMRGWIYRNVILSFPTIFGGGDYIVTLYFNPWQCLVRGWIYCDIIFSLLTIISEGVNISWHYIFTPDNIWWGGDYIVTLYFYPWQYLVRGWIYRDIIFSLLAIFGGGWLYRDILFSLLTIISEGVNISWHYILVRGWSYGDIIFSLLTIFGQGVIISWHNILTPDNIWSGGDYIVVQYSHPWQYLVRGWLYRDIIFSLLTIFREGWLYCDIIFSLLTIFVGVCVCDYIVTLYFHPWQYLVRGDYIVTQYSHPWQYLVRGWLYRDIIFSLLTIFGQGGDYIVTLYNQGVIISWHYIFDPGNIWSGVIISWHWLSCTGCFHLLYV